MGTIAEKLSYLADTKDLFKDRLNSLGAEIIESTAFRNYLNWLDTFYGKVSDKTDLAKNGVVGRTSQERTTGKNLLPNNANSQTINGVTFTVNEDKSITVNGTATANSFFEFFNGNILLGNTITAIRKTTKSSPTQYPRLLLSIGGTEYNVDNVESHRNYRVFTGGRTLTKAGIGIQNGETYNETLYCMIVDGETTDNETYESYTGGKPSPSPDYPQEIINLSGDVEYKVRGKNLFNKGNYIELNGTPNTSGTFTGGGANYNIVIPCQPNTTYTIQKRNDGNTNRFAFCCSKTIPSDADSVQTQILNGTRNDTASEITITTASTAKYLIAHYYRNAETALTKQQLLDSIQIEEGNQATPYEPYISESFPLSLKSKNLFDKDNANVLNAYFAQEKIITSSSAGKTLYISCKPNTTYIISRIAGARFRVLTTETTPTLNVHGIDYQANDNTTSLTITTSNNANYLCVYYYSSSNDTKTEQQILDSIQIEEGSTATTYEPYYDINLCNISDYKDRIYSQNGEFYLEKNTDKIILNGSELIDIFSVTGGKLFRCRDIAISVSDISPKSNYFIGVSNSSSRYDGTVYYNYNASADHMVFDILTTKFTTVAEFKSWLSTHNTELQFAIPTPITTEITSSNYPELYNALKEIQDYLVSYKINKEFLLDYSSPEIEY